MSVWVEMSKDPIHGGLGWELGSRLWSPNHAKPNKNGVVRRQPYWSLLHNVKKGDTVIHLKGQQFVGVSTAASDFYLTSSKPPQSGDWDYAEEFKVVDLENFTKLSLDVSLTDFFENYNDRLNEYFDSNSRATHKRLLFYVRQSGRLQCQNGAYMSEVKDDLLNIFLELGDFDYSPESKNEIKLISDVGEALRQSLHRKGQNKFASEVKKNFKNICAFPDCFVDDKQFLHASHIEAWKDNKEKRGSTSNGICFCVLHHKAFDTGYFFLTNDLSVQLTKKCINSKWAKNTFFLAKDKKIKPSEVGIDSESLLKHREKIEADT